jgi:hypothetical protein
LYISLVKDPIMSVFFKDADELADSGLRLHAGTTYITSTSDVRLPYPQIEIVDTTGGAGAGDGSANTVDPAALSNQDLDAVSTGGLRGPGAKKARAPVEPDFDEKTTGRRKR